MRFLKSKTALISLTILIALIGWYVYINVFESNMGIFGEMANKKIKIRNDEGEILELEVEVADQPDERAKGFQNAPKRIINSKVILFVFDTDSMPFFHMRNVVSSLDIAFIKADGKIIEIEKMLPGSPQVYGPPEPIRYVIEARSGFFQENKISAGSSQLLIDSLKSGG